MDLSFYSMDRKVDKYREDYLIIVVVTQTSLRDGIESIGWEGESFDLQSKHASVLINQIANERIKIMRGLHAQRARLSRAVRAGSSKRKTSTQEYGATPACCPQTNLWLLAGTRSSMHTQVSRPVGEASACACPTPGSSTGRSCPTLSEPNGARHRDRRRSARDDAGRRNGFAICLARCLGLPTLQLLATCQDACKALGASELFVVVWRARRRKDLRSGLFAFRRRHVLCVGIAGGAAI